MHRTKLAYLKNELRLVSDPTIMLGKPAFLGPQARSIPYAKYWDEFRAEELMLMNLVDNYSLLNRSKKRRLIFHLTSRGFGSELNNLVLAILYCLVHGIEFCLNSRYWNAAVQLGWQDYFLPFCRESHHSFFYRGDVFEPVNSRRRLHRILYRSQKILFPNTLYHHDIWGLMTHNDFLSQKFHFPELGIDGDIFHAKQIILEMVYRLNDATSSEIAARERMLEGHSPYVGIHIRRGDKITTGEAKETPIAAYVDAASNFNRNGTKIFLATDDYSAVEEFQQSCPADWKVMTFCDPDQRGHLQDEFNQRTERDKREAMLGLLGEIQFLADSEFFIGTHSGNLSRLIALLRRGKNIRSLDTEWKAD